MKRMLISITEGISGFQEIRGKIKFMKLCGLKAGVSLYRCVNIIHAGFILTLKGEVFSGI